MTKTINFLVLAVCFIASQFVTSQAGGLIEELLKCRPYGYQ